MARRLFTLLSALSLLLCAAVIVLWVRSYFYAITAYGDHATGYSSLAVSRGNAGFAHAGDSVWTVTGVEYSRGGAHETPSDLWDPQAFWVATDARLDLLGFHFRGGPAPGGHGWVAVVPLWQVALLTLPLPARWLWLAGRARRRRSRHLCLACGYDLRATPGRCPECGAVPAGEQA